jgi:hypothetical protein
MPANVALQHWKNAAMGGCLGFGEARVRCCSHPASDGLLHQPSRRQRGEIDLFIRVGAVL